MANIIFLVWIIKPQSAQNYFRLNAQTLYCAKGNYTSKWYNGQRSLASVDLKKVVCLKLPGLNIIYMKVKKKSTVVDLRKLDY